MANQTGKNIGVAFEVQSAKGTPASGAGGTGLRINPSPGLRLQKAVIANDEVRRDGQSTRGRHGTKMVPPGTYETNLSVGSLDEIIQAAIRSTWTAADVLTEADFTSITTTTNTIVAAGGSWLTMGVRRGDVIKLTNHATAANNDKWFRVVGVTASTITLPAGSLTLDASADIDCDLTIAKTIVNGATPIERYFTFEERNIDLGQSFVFTDVKISQISITAAPDANIIVSITLLGLDGELLPAAAEYFTSPTYTTTLPLIMADGKIRVNGVDYTDLTAFSMIWNLGGSAPAGLGPNAIDVFLNNAQLSGSISAVRRDDVFFNAFRDETTLDLMMFCTEAESVVEPKPFVSFYIGNAVFDGNDGPIGGDGPLIETIPWRAGKDEAGTDRAATMLKISTSAT